MKMIPAMNATMAARNALCWLRSTVLPKKVKVVCPPPITVAL